MGMQRMAKKPNTEDAHRGFRALYILLAKSCREKGRAGEALGVRSRGLAYWESSTKDTTDKGLVRHTRAPF
jgi:hypothetical protein